MAGLTEDQEQSAFVLWLRANKYDHFHVPNSTYTKSWAQKTKNTRLGVSAGVPDIFVFAGGKRFAIEMKRASKGVVSTHQRKWLEKLAEYGFIAAVCNGRDEAVELIESEVGERKQEL